MNLRRVSDDQRRARLAQRHALAPGARVGSAREVTNAMTVLHATEAASVHLAVHARSDAALDDVDRALFEERSLVRQLAMRRTLFIFDRDLLPAALGAPSARVAQAHRRRILKTVAENQLTDDAQGWLEQVSAEVIGALHSSAGAPNGLTTTEIRQLVPAIAGKITVSPGTKWGGEIPLAPWILTQLGLQGEIVRGSNDLAWHRNRFRWQPMQRWLGEAPVPTSESDGYRELIGRYLASFGPATQTDLQWWLGSTKTAVRQALTALEAHPVALDGIAEPGWLLPDDLDDVPDPGDWVALLSTLDPSTMGWKLRDFYLDPTDRPYLFDSVGNGGTTAWVNGRIVGCWVQDGDARVRVVLRHAVPKSVRCSLDEAAERLTGWLAGVTISNVYSSALMKSAVLG